MAKITVEDKEKEVSDGEPILQPCEELGVPFGCTEGICGSCLIDVVEGFENLSDITQAEKDMAVGSNQRLACQCKIKQGHVKIKY